MINTIFYFAPDSFDEQAYRNGLDSENGVSSRTIVFSPSQKAIYKGGVRYGSMSIEDMKEYITQILQQDPTIINNGSDYDDSAIRALINAERDRINQLLANMDQSIINKMNQLFSDKNWLDTNVIDKIQSESNFGEEDVDEYLQRIGLYTVSGNNKTWAWSSIAQDVDSIELEVNQIKSNQQIGGQVDYELLSSNVYAYINDNAASSGLQSTWGKFLQLSNGDLARLKWVSTGIANEASSEQGVVDLFAAAQEYAEVDNGATKLTQAYAGLNALVEQDAHGNWVAKESLSSMIDDKVASIQTIVRKDANTGAIDSNVIISGDQIDFVNSDGIGGWRITQNSLQGNTSGPLGYQHSSSELNPGMIKIGYLDVDDPVDNYVKIVTNSSSDYIEIYNSDGGGTVTLDDTGLTVEDSNNRILFENTSSGGINVWGDIVSTNGTVNASGFVVDNLHNASDYVLQADGGYILKSLLGGGSSSWNGGSITGDITLNGGAKIANSTGTIDINGTDGEIDAYSCQFGIVNVRPMDNGLIGPKINIGTASQSGIELTNSQITFKNSSSVDTVILADTGLSIENGETNSSANWQRGTFSHNALSFDYGTTETVNIDCVTGNADFGGEVTSRNGTCQGSDITKKDVIADTTITVDQIADAPSIQFTWKKDTNKTPHVGTSAQYWQTVMPEVITEKNDTVFMDYSSAALVSAITIAKEVVSLKEEIAQLKQQIAELKGNNNE